MGLVSYGTVDSWRTRRPFKSVGLVCGCGNAVSGYEGTLMRCVECGCLYSVSVMIVAMREPHRATDSTAPPAFADGPVADTAEPITTEARRPIPEPDRNHGDAMPHGR